MKKGIMIPSILFIWVTGLVVMGYNFYALQGIDLEMEQLVALRVELLVRTIMILAIITGAYVLILARILHQITLPILQLTNEAKSFAQGGYKHSVRNYPVEEVQQLANAFDYMGEKLYRNNRTLRYQKTKAESMLANLHEGIITLDEEGYVIEVNAFAKQLLGFAFHDRDYYHMTSYMRNPQFAEMLQEVMGKNIRKEIEIVWGEKVLYISAAPIKQQATLYGYIVVARDMSKMRELEEMRYQFVTNVSHELKTPLTSIQGFVETLKDGAIENPKMAMRFLDIIDIEAKRLYRLIQEVLLLSEIENMDNLCTEDTDLIKVIEEVVAMLMPRAKEKGLTLTSSLDGPCLLHHVREDHMKQVVLNLVSNAIRYTDEGSICIQTKTDQDTHQLVIKDTGIGMDEESVGRIFERFYTVDKSRSRKSGGTGLGLSIVKHIVQLYGGTITVESKKGIGSTFTISNL